MTSISPVELQLERLSGPATRLQWLREHRLLGPSSLLAARGVIASELADLAEGLLARNPDVSAGQLAEERRVFAGLVDQGLRVLALKGCLVAYLVYPAPTQRWRADLDVLVAPDDLKRARSTLESLDYMTPYSVVGGAPINQESWVRSKSDQTHYIDLHWSMRKHPVLRDRLSFDEQWAHAVALPELAPGARGQCRVHALLNAVLHWFDKIYPDPSPYGWLLDIDLLWRQMGHDERQTLETLAGKRGLAGLLAEALSLARLAFDTPVGESVIDSLSHRGRGQRPTRLIALQGHPLRGHLFSLACETGFRGKMHRIRSTVFPPVTYMRERYGVTGTMPLVRAYWARARRRLRDSD